jgi:chromosome segregation ATPase
MNPDLAPLIPVAAIIMFGLVRISRHWRSGGESQNLPATRQLEERLEAVEEQLAALQGELGEANERLDFAERLLAQTQEAKRLPRQPE